MVSPQTIGRFRSELQRFLESTEHPLSMMFTRGGLHIYIRRCWHLVAGEAYACLDIASVSVRDQRQGTFKRILAIAQELCPWNAVRIELNYNGHLVRFFREKCGEDPRWVEEGAQEAPDFIWFKDRDGEYTLSRRGGAESRADALHRLTDRAVSYSDIMNGALSRHATKPATTV